MGTRISKSFVIPAAIAVAILLSLAACSGSSGDRRSPSLPPVISVCSITGQQRGMVDACYDLSDPDGDMVSVAVEY